MKALASLVLLTLPLTAQSTWTSADTAREAAVVAVSAADWGQTLNIQERSRDTQLSNDWTRHDDWHEENPLLGRYPSRARINTYFASTIVLHGVIAYLLPPKWRHAFQYISLGFEMSVVTHNYQLGFQVRF